MIDLQHTFWVAMGNPGQGQSTLVSFIPLALIVAIFYFLILMPMKRRQKKIDEFQQSLKVGDRVVTTGGIYGQITRVSDKSVQMQIADKVRIEIARAAIGGYQGQDPIVSDNGNT